MATEIMQLTLVAIVMGIVSIFLIRIVIPGLYRQDRRIAQFIYLDFFWIAVFFIVFLYEKSTIASLGFAIGKDPMLTLEYTIISVIATLFLFIISAKREKRNGILRIKNGFLIIGNEKVDLRIVSLPGFVQIFLMQIMWVGLPEEIFFRGYLVTRIAQSFSDMAGVLVAAIFYFVAFLDKPIFGNINLILALLWGYSLVATGSIVPAVVGHIFINTMSFYFARNIVISSRV
ncbi:MAG: CPBP family intramembrane glutamic endopeptidase [Candidatus Methanofastidiosia archaeon]